MKWETCPWLSDHCPLYYNINLKGNLNTKLEQCEQLEDAPPSPPTPRFIWNSSSKVKFEGFLKSDTSKQMFEELARNQNLSPANLVSCLTGHIITCATKSGLKTSPKKSYPPGKSAPWFDKECKELKKKMTSLANNLRKLPNDNKIRENIFFIKRKFQAAVKKKKTAIDYNCL